MEVQIDWFREILDAVICLYFSQKFPVSSIYGIPQLEGKIWKKICGRRPGFDEEALMMLVLMPHLCPQTLDIFFAANKNFDRPYMEFGGWRGSLHNGFLPTGETAVFFYLGPCLFQVPDPGRKSIRIGEIGTAF